MTTSEPGTPSRSGAADDVDALLGPGTRRPWWRSSALWIAVLLLAGAYAGWQYWRGVQAEAQRPAFVTQPVARGDITVSVTANGTLQPTRAVNIGSELSGTVARVLVDINDQVTRGQVLAELDTAKFNDQVRRSRASVASGQARVAQAAATVKEARANLGRMEEVARLSGGKVPSQAELDAGRAALERALADAKVAEAALSDARAALSVDETNLRKASIRSPIDGVVLTRSVDPGNAVAASLQAVTLFNVAEDLTKMKLKVDVDEADVGQVREGQSAEFTVSAWPGRRYPARILRVGYGSTIKDNVVSYVAELEVGNEDLSLRPGMTATATIKATERVGVLTVPNAALRFSPAGVAPAGGGSPGAPGATSGAPAGTGPAAPAGNGAAAPPAAGASAPAAQTNGGLVSRLVPQMPRRPARRGGVDLSAVRQVWVLRDGQPVAVPITPGVSDGRMTEILSGALTEDDQVIVEQTTGRAG